MTGAPTSHYREHRPPAPLARHLVCTWTQRIGPGEACHPQRVLPDGCADLVWIGAAAPVVVGPATRTVVAPLPAGAIVIGARFCPGLAPCLLGVPASELLDRELPLLDLWGPAADRLSAQLAEAEGAAAKLAVLEAALARRPVNAGRADPLVVAAIAWLARRPAGRVGELSRTIGISDRQLHRRFRATVGYGPKTLQRILRFQRLLALARGTGGRFGPAALALEAGYADQAHMSREVRALAGRPPSALLAQAGSTLALSDLFKTPPWPNA
jgi:AraC-like DNA-binding protein